MMKPARKTLLYRRSVGTLTAICALHAATVMAEEIRIGGTGNALGTMRLLGEAFVKKNPNMKVSVLNSIGSSGAIKAVPSGVLDIGLSARALSASERTTGIIVTEYARTPTVLAVSTRLKITGISREQLADVYSGKLAAWPDGTPTRPVLRQPGDDNSIQVKALSPAIDKALSAADRRRGLPFAVIDQEAADKTESIPGAICVTTLALIMSESRALRPLAIDNVEPTVQNVAAGKYPMVKHFYFVTRSAPSSKVQELIAFVKSSAGREILTNTGHWVP